MNADTIARLVIAIGPAALELVPKLHALWTKPTLTTEEVQSLCAPAKKSYDDYIAAAKARNA